MDIRPDQNQENAAKSLAGHVVEVFSIAVERAEKSALEARNNHSVRLADGRAPSSLAKAFRDCFLEETPEQYLADYRSLDSTAERQRLLRAAGLDRPLSRWVRQSFAGPAAGFSVEQLAYRKDIVPLQLYAEVTKDLEQLAELSLERLTARVDVIDNHQRAGNFAVSLADCKKALFSKPFVQKENSPEADALFLRLQEMTFSAAVSAGPEELLLAARCGRKFFAKEKDVDKLQARHFLNAIHVCKQLLAATLQDAETCHSRYNAALNLYNAVCARATIAGEEVCTRVWGEHESRIGTGLYTLSLRIYASYEEYVERFPSIAIPIGLPPGFLGIGSRLEACHYQPGQSMTDYVPRPAFLERIEEQFSAAEQGKQPLEHAWLFHSDPGTGKSSLIRNWLTSLNEGRQAAGQKRILACFLQQDDYLSSVFDESRQKFSAAMRAIEAEMERQNCIAVVVIEEIDRLIPRSRVQADSYTAALGRSATDTENDRIMATLLQYTDNIKPVRDLFIIGTTNAIYDLDPAAKSRMHAIEYKTPFSVRYKTVADMWKRAHAWHEPYVEPEPLMIHSTAACAAGMDLRELERFCGEMASSRNFVGSTRSDRDAQIFHGFLHESPPAPRHDHDERVGAQSATPAVHVSRLGGTVEFSFQRCVEAARACQVAGSPKTELVAIWPDEVGMAALFMGDFGLLFCRAFPQPQPAVSDYHFRISFFRDLLPGDPDDIPVTQWDGRASLALEEQVIPPALSQGRPVPNGLVSDYFYQTLLPLGRGTVIEKRLQPVTNLIIRFSWRTDRPQADTSFSFFEEARGPGSLIQFDARQ